MKKNIIIGICLLVVSALMLFACGGGSAQKPEATEATSGPAEAQTEELTTEEETTEEETTEEETTTEKKTTKETEEDESTEEETTEDPDHLAEDGWFVSDGLAVRIDAYYFNTENEELMVEGEINVVEEGATISPAAVMEMKVYQEGVELGFIAGADLNEPLTSESQIILQDIYATISDVDDIEIEVTFESGESTTWSANDFE